MTPPPTRWIVRSDEAGMRLDRFLSDRIPQVSRGRIQEVLRTRVDLSWPARVRAATPVVAGGTVALSYEPIREEPWDGTIPVIARGSGWIAVDKPAGMPVHPVRTVRQNSLVHVMRRQRDDPALRLGHRLDRETSGVLILASDPDTAAAVSGAFEAGRVHKEYLAVVRGLPGEPQGVMDWPVGPAVGSRIAVRQGTAAGRPARTAWTLERAGDSNSLLRLEPATGRRHQIRVHLEALGHPIVGDMIYGRGDDDYLGLAERGHDPRDGIREPRRQLLHCAHIRIDTPGVQVDCRSPMPDEFRRWYETRSPLEQD